MRNITRAEPEFFAWLASITLRRRHYSRYFPDGPDGPFESLRAAIAWRDETWARIGPPSKVRLPGDRSTASIPGITLEVRAAGDRYVASWPDADGKTRRQRFSTDKYGKAEARRLAIAARDAGLAATSRERERRLLDKLHMHRTVLRSRI